MFERGAVKYFYPGRALASSPVVFYRSRKDVPTSIPYLISWKPETTENQGDASTDNEAVKAVNGVNATALVAVVGAPLNLIAAINQAEQDRDRKGELVKKISTPCGLEVMEQARKALVRLQGFQSKRFNATANTAPSIRGSRMLDSAFDQYRQDLVYDEINSISMVSMEQSCCRRTRQVLVPEEHIVACCNGKVFSQTQHQGRHLVDVTLSIQEHPKELLCRVRKTRHGVVFLCRLQSFEGSFRILNEVL